MKLPGFRRLNKQDFTQENRDLVEQLASNLNIGIEVLYDLANNKISLRDNILSVVRDVTVKVDANGIPFQVPSLALGVGITQVLGIQVILASNRTNASVYPTGGVFCTFTQNGNNIIINHVAGLPANNDFLLRIVVFG